ncbi:MAG: N-acetyl-gamma-glutamyl-phosphate reductase [Rhodothermales bacterium]
MSYQPPYYPQFSAAVVHGSGYVGRELIRLLEHHPAIDLKTVVSGSAAGKVVHEVHPTLRGISSLTFTDAGSADLETHDVVFVAGVPGTGTAAFQQLTSAGFDGVFIDLSTDYRFADPADHLKWNGSPRDNDGSAGEFVYGLPEICAPYPADTRLIANPGCFATGLALSIWPLASNLHGSTVHVTALTGASGSGASPSKTTHFPDRDGNVRAYKVFGHRHLGEVLQTVGDSLSIAFVPVSGPWTRGIWGTAQVTIPAGIDAEDVTGWFEAAYSGKAFVRLWGDQLPELHYAVGSPFCDIGWKVAGNDLVVVFALDNLLKGAASQAVQNANLALGMPEGLGLIPGAQETASTTVDTMWD